MRGRKIVVGVSGSIAAYKACELVSKLRQQDADVRVVMTRSATEFVGTATLRALSGRNVACEMFDVCPDEQIEHVSLAEFGEVMIVAPATANVIGKVAAGVCDDLLTTTISAAACPVIFAPAMNWRMWENPITQANVKRLQALGYVFVEPEEGWLACGESKAGRLASTDKLLTAIEKALGIGDSKLAGKQVMVTAGPTREWVDPVRFISNPSSGKMGYALAEEAARRGAKVTLISGPTALPAPAGAELVNAETAEQMAEAVQQHLPGTDVFVGAAAVADWRPVQQADAKLKKSQGAPELKLEATPDIIAQVSASAQRPAVVVGFAAETEDLEKNARQKLDDKALDIIVANDLSAPGAGFGSDTNAVTIFDRDGNSKQIDTTTKRKIASEVLDSIEQLLGTH